MKTLNKAKCTNEMKLRIQKILSNTRRYDCCGKHMRTTFKKYTDDICPHCEPELYLEISNYLKDTKQYQEIESRRNEALSSSNNVKECISAISSNNSFVLSQEQLLELEEIRLKFKDFDDSSDGFYDYEDINLKYLSIEDLELQDVA